MKTLILSIFLTCTGAYYFMNEYHWKKVNPEGYAKSKDEAELILKSKRNKEKESTKRVSIENQNTRLLMLRIN
ncbi:hypothetical protein PBAC_13080 [Pedobacter glucosidilyticus]|nr:hypothetical protein [Pedobacter glucosidilyticus]KHJ38513.1 hypothetical protein PBAC_13080 [Pedobacter glucosidilyticus]